MISFSRADDDLTITDEACDSCGSPQSREFQSSQSQSQSQEKRKPPKSRPPRDGRQGEAPQLTEEEVMRQLENMPSEQREEIMKGYQEYLKQQEQTPEVQEELHNSFPQLNYPDTAYKSFNEIAASKIPPKAFGML